MESCQLICQWSVYVQLRIDELSQFTRLYVTYYSHDIRLPSCIHLFSSTRSFFQPKSKDKDSQKKAADEQVKK